MMCEFLTQLPETIICLQNKDSPIACFIAAYEVFWDHDQWWFSTRKKWNIQYWIESNLIQLRSSLYFKLTWWNQLFLDNGQQIRGMLTTNTVGKRVSHVVYSEFAKWDVRHHKTEKLRERKDPCRFAQQCRETGASASQILSLQSTSSEVRSSVCSILLGQAQAHVLLMNIETCYQKGLIELLTKETREGSNGITFFYYFFYFSNSKTPCECKTWISERLRVPPIFN